MLCTALLCDFKSQLYDKPSGCGQELGLSQPGLPSLAYGLALLALASKTKGCWEIALQIFPGAQGPWLELGSEVRGVYFPTHQDKGSPRRFLLRWTRLLYESNLRV